MELMASQIENSISRVILRTYYENFNLANINLQAANVTMKLPYMWKFLQYVIFVVFVDDGSTAKIQHLKILNLAYL